MSTTINELLRMGAVAKANNLVANKATNKLHLSKRFAAIVALQDICRVAEIELPATTAAKLVAEKKRIEKLFRGE